MDCRWDIFSDPEKCIPDDRYPHIAFALQDAATSGLVSKTEYRPSGENTWAHDRLRTVLCHKRIDLRCVMENALLAEDEIIVWLLASHGVYTPTPRRTAMTNLLQRAHANHECNLHATLQSILTPHGVNLCTTRIICDFLIADTERTCLCWFCQ